MNSIYFKVNGKGQYKNYMNGSFGQASEAFHDLIDRATAKGFQKVRHSFGCCGVILTYSDGKTKVEIVFINNEKELEWLMFLDKKA